jgi:hypothetical protein
MCPADLDQHLSLEQRRRSSPTVQPEHPITFVGCSRASPDMRSECVLDCLSELAFGRPRHQVNSYEQNQRSQLGHCPSDGRVSATSRHVQHATTKACWEHAWKGIRREAAHASFLHMTRSQRVQNVDCLLHKGHRLPLGATISVNESAGMRPRSWRRLMKPWISVRLSIRSDMLHPHRPSEVFLI